MNSTLSTLSVNTKISIFVTCLLVVAIIVYVVLSALSKKGKLKGKTDATISRTNALFLSFGNKVRAKFSEKSKITILYYIVTISTLVAAVLSLIIEIMNGGYSLTFIKSLIYVAFILFLIVNNSEFAPRESYYYNYNPLLFYYSAISLFFAIIEFCTALAASSFIVSIPTFVGELLMYGVIFFTRYSKKEFKPRSILVYLGGLILAVCPIISFVLLLVNIGSFSYVALSVISSFFGLISGVSLTILLLYFYDSFGFLVRLFRKR